MNPILVEVKRGGVVESFHRGVICIVDRDGNVIYSEGDVHQLCYPRSALKFFQQIPLLTSGAADAFGFTSKELAVMCGSHGGEPEHVEMVDSILHKIGLQRENLLCGAQVPSGRQAANALQASGMKPEAIHNNCSGKHAGFLAMSVFLGAPAEDYLDPEHPVQKEIRKVCAEFHSYGEQQMVTALDGCSAPIYSIPVYNQALAYMRLVNPEFGDQTTQKACRRLVEAVSEHPMMIAGTERYCTDLIRTCSKELVGKTGAEGIFSIAFHKEVLGATIKIDDGKMQPQYQVAQKLILRSGLFSRQELTPLDKYLEMDIVNFNKWKTGSSVVSDAIFAKPWR